MMIGRTIKYRYFRYDLHQQYQGIEFHEGKILDKYRGISRQKAALAQPHSVDFYLVLNDAGEIVSVEPLDVIELLPFKNNFS